MFKFLFILRFNCKAYKNPLWSNYPFPFLKDSIFVFLGWRSFRYYFYIQFNLIYNFIFIYMFYKGLKPWSFNILKHYINYNSAITCNNLTLIICLLPLQIQQIILWLSSKSWIKWEVSLKKTGNLKREDNINRKLCLILK